MAYRRRLCFGRAVGKFKDISLAALFGAGAIAVAVAIVALNLGWRPPLPIWDERAQIVTQLALWVELAAMCLGVSERSPEPRLPKRLKTLPENACLLVPSFFLAGAISLSEGMSWGEAASRLAVGAATGLVLSVFAAFLGSFVQSAEAKAPDPWVKPRRALSMAAATAVIWAVVACAPRTPDDGEFRTYLHLQRGEQTLVIGVKRTALFGDEYGLLRICDAAGANALVLKKDEWRSLTELWNRARAAGAPASIGTARDSGVSDQSTLSIDSTETGVRLQISSKRAATVDFKIDRTEFEAVTAALKQADQDLPR